MSCRSRSEKCQTLLWNWLWWKEVKSTGIWTWKHFGCRIVHCRAQPSQWKAGVLDIAIWGCKIIHKPPLATRGKRKFSNNFSSFMTFYFVIMSILQVVAVNVKNIYIGAIPVDAFAVLNFAKSNTWIFNIPKCFYKAYSHFQGKIQLPLAHTEEKLPFETAILRKQCYRAQSSGIAMHNVRAISFCL